jgi:hypothetical protein
LLPTMAIQRKYKRTKRWPVSEYLPADSSSKRVAVHSIVGMTRPLENKTIDSSKDHSIFLIVVATSLLKLNDSR